MPRAFPPAAIGHHQDSPENATLAERDTLGIGLRCEKVLSYRCHVSENKNNAERLRIYVQ